MSKSRPKSSSKARLRSSCLLLVASLVIEGLLVSPVSAADRPADARHHKVWPGLRPHLVAYYDFEHPDPQDVAKEQDQGFSDTDIDLVGDAEAMRVADAAYPGAGAALQTRQVDPTVAGNDDWKAGVYSSNGVSTLHDFNAVRGITVMGWFKVADGNPGLNSNTADPNDFYNAIGLAGVLSGDSDGHAVRALLELIEVDGELRLVALGRRIDGGLSQTFAAREDWRTLLPENEWVFLAATFDFHRGTMALYRNGRKLDGFYTRTDDPWDVGGPGRHVTSPTDPRGIKIGGSFPQNTREANPCTCRMDELMFLDRVLSSSEIRAHYRFVTGSR